MKILHIISTLAGGGAERLVAQMAPLMNRGGNKCDVLTLSDMNAIYVKLLHDCGVFVRVAPYKNRYNFRLLFYIRRIISQGEYDIVHAHTFPAIYWTSLAAHCIKRKFKLLMTEHNTVNRRRNSPWLKPLEKLIYYRYDAIISVSEETRQMLLRWLKPKRTQKYLMVNNGINIIPFKEATPFPRDTLGIHPYLCLLGVFGSFTKQKNHATFIRALTLLAQGIHVVFAGEGPLFESSVLLSETLGVKDRVHFLGFRQDVERIMKTVDVVVIPSLWEGLCLVAVEAMACGKPIAASNVSGLQEVIGNCGILFDPVDPEDIAGKISSLLTDKALLSHYAIQSVNCAEKFTIEKAVMKHMEVYKNMQRDI